MSEGTDPFLFDKPPQEAKYNYEQLTYEELLQNYSLEDIKEFVFDLYLIFNIYEHVKAARSNYSTSAESDVEQFKKLINLWNEKYRNILFNLDDTYEFRLHIWFTKAHSRMREIVPHLSGFEKLESTNPIKAVFEEGNCITLQKVGDKHQLFYLMEDMLKPMSPEFRLCVYFGMLDDYERSINIQECSTWFSFSSPNKDVSWGRRYAK